MTKTEASTALLINSCPIMAQGRRQRAENETFSLSFSISFSFVASPANEQPSGTQLLPRLH